MMLIGPILPPPEVTPTPWLWPIWPPVVFLGLCPLCGHPLANGAQVGLSAQGLAHVACGGAG